MRNLLLLLTIFAVLLLTIQGKNKKKNKQMSAYDKHLRDKKAEMRASFCSMFDEELALNCIFFHLDYECFLKYFGKTGLEFGEYSQTKENNFVDCYKGVYNGGLRK